MSRITPTDPIYNYLLILTVIILIVKAVIIVFLAKKISKRKETEGEFKVDFLFAIFILTTCLFISRVFLLYFDFFLTYFDPSEFWKPENVWAWKAGESIVTFGVGVLILVVDKEALRFKLKRIPAIFTFVIMVILIIYPVNSFDDFTIISILFVIGILPAGFIPFIFLYIAIKTDGLRKTALSVFFGLIIYLFGSLMVLIQLVEIITETYGDSGLRVLYLLSVLGKIIGLLLLAYAAPKIYKPL